MNHNNKKPNEPRSRAEWERAYEQEEEYDAPRKRRPDADDGPFDCPIFDERGEYREDDK